MKEIRVRRCKHFKRRPAEAWEFSLTTDGAWLEIQGRLFNPDKHRFREAVLKIREDRRGVHVNAKCVRCA